MRLKTKGDAFIRIRIGFKMAGVSRAHGGIIAQWAGFVRVMAAAIFVIQKPCKH
jgi:hypothetical protein